MAIERVSKFFKDISMSFEVSPLNKDLIAIKNETAIARSIRNLVSTLKGESFYSNKGSNVNKLLFEPITSITSAILENEVSDVIKQYEPRVSLIKVEATPDYDNYGYDLVIQYTIVGIDVPPQQLTFVLENTR